MKNLYLGTFFVALLILQALAQAGDLVNYENDAELSKAISYDSELNGGDRKTASQSLAEMHYLAYLTHSSNVDQIARVYVQLGVLFSTNWHREYGEKPDYEKARHYFAEALKVAPDRLGVAMIRARLGMATPLQSSDERFDIRLKAYKWLVSVDKNQLKEHWLKASPSDVPRADEIQAELGIFQNVIVAEQDNVLFEARKSSDSAKALERIVREVPTSQLALVAERIQAKLVASTQVGVSIPANPTPANATPANTIPAEVISESDLKPLTSGKGAVNYWVFGSVIAGTGVFAVIFRKRLLKR